MQVVFRNTFFIEHHRRPLGEHLRRDYDLIGHSPNCKSSIFFQTKKKETKIQKIKKIPPFCLRHHISVINSLSDGETKAATGGIP